MEATIIYLSINGVVICGDYDKFTDWRLIDADGSDLVLAMTTDTRCVDVWDIIEEGA